MAGPLSGWRVQARKGMLVVPINAAPAFVPLLIAPSISDTAAAAVGGTGAIGVKICGAVLLAALDCSPEPVAPLTAASSCARTDASHGDRMTRIALYTWDIV